MTELHVTRFAATVASHIFASHASARVMLPELPHACIKVERMTTSDPLVHAMIKTLHTERLASNLAELLQQLKKASWLEPQVA